MKPFARKRTFSRSRLVKFLSGKTVEGSNNYPCNIESGPRTGEPCVLAWFFPDCSLMKPSGGCEAQLKDTAPIERHGCIRENNDNLWCSSKTYLNRSHITGEWGYCSSDCVTRFVRSQSLHTIILPT